MIILCSSVSSIKEILVTGITGTLAGILKSVSIFYSLIIYIRLKLSLNEIQYKNKARYGKIGQLCERESQAD